MKFTKVLFAVLSFALIHPNLHAANPSGSVGQQDLQPTEFTWAELRTFVQGCAVQPVTQRGNGRLEYLSIVSICPKTLTVHGATARFKLKKVAYVATLLDSAYADQGDFNTLVVRNTQGVLLAQADHLPAFGDILLALAGGDDSFRQVSVDPQAIDP